MKGLQWLARVLLLTKINTCSTRHASQDKYSYFINIWVHYCCHKAHVCSVLNHEVKEIMLCVFVETAGGNHEAGSWEAAVRRSGILRDRRRKGDLCQINHTRRNSRVLGQTASGRQAAQSECWHCPVTVPPSTPWTYWLRYEKWKTFNLVSCALSCNMSLDVLKPYTSLS